MEIIQYQGREIRRWKRGPSSFLVAPEEGARLMNWNVALGDGSIRDVIYWPESIDDSAFAKVRGGNPILFPFAGTSYAKALKDHWLHPDGHALSMPQHGFVRQGNFKIASIDEYGFAAEFVPTEENLAQFPYDYSLLVVYRFADLHLQVSLVLENHGDKTLPWSPGYHFYFYLPWRQNLTRNDFLLNIPARKRFAYQADGSLSKLDRKTGPINFSDKSLVNCVHTGLQEPEAIFGTANDEENVSVRIEGGGSVETRCFVTWTEDDASPFYCVEPWMAPPNPTANPQGPRYVSAGQRDEFTVEVKLL